MSEGDKLLFVNDDAVFGADAFKILSRAEHEFDRLGVIGPKGSIWRDCKHEAFVNGTGKVDVVSGFAFLVSAKIFDQVGGIDVEYTPAGCEEVDFCFKVSAAGYQNYAHEKIPIKTEPAHGISARNESIHYFNSTITTRELHLKNTAYLRQKWSKA